MNMNIYNLEAANSFVLLYKGAVNIIFRLRLGF
jgi:hypothetical protein